MPLYFDIEVGQRVAIQPGQPEKLLCGAGGVEHICKGEQGETISQTDLWLVLQNGHIEKREIRWPCSPTLTLASCYPETPLGFLSFYLTPVLTCWEFQEHAVPQNGSRGRPLFWDLGGKVNFFFSEQLILAFVQVPSSIEGPGCVAAEAIFDRVEQIDFLFTRRGRRWRAYTSEDQLGANNWVPPDHSWYGELIVSFNCNREHSTPEHSIYIQPHFTPAPMFTNTIHFFQLGEM